MITLNNINLSSIDLSGIDLRGIKLGLGGRGGGSGDGFPVLPGDVTRWHFGGLTNEMMAAMDDPRLEDVDGKGRFLTFKNFAWSEMSGCGGFDYDFTKKSILNYSGANVNAKISSDTLYIEKVDNSRVNVVIRLAQFKCRLKITGVSDSINSGEIQSLRMYSSKDFDNRITINTDGIYDVDISNQEGGLIYIFAVSSQGTMENPLTLTTPITIEQLPLYPGFIIGDGVDDYAVTEKDLDFEDTYTVYTAFIPFAKESGSNSILCGKLFTKDFDLRYTTTNIAFYSAESVIIETMSNGFNLIACKRTSDTLQFKNLLTGVTKKVAANVLLQNPGLYYLWRSMGAAQYANAAIAGQVICNGHFTTDEEDTKVLNWYKKEYPWLFFDEAWTVTGKSNEDTDRATIANITGNGNNLVLSNFGFAGNSGYGEYVQNFNIDKWTIATPSRVEATKTNSSFNITEVKGTAIQLYYLSAQKEVAFTIPSTKVRVTGLTDGQTINYRYFVDDVANDFLIPSDGIYNLPEFEFPAKGDYYGFNLTKVQSSCNITIEQIPDYEGYLVTDGVDDKVYSSAFTLGKKFTVVGEWKLLNNEIANAGIIKNGSLFIYNTISGLRVFINRAGNSYYVKTKTLRAIVSDGRMYDDNWKEYLDTNKQLLDKSGGAIFIGSSEAGSLFTRLIFKNLAIYPRFISKEDCIKAYIYLQTLKAK